MNSIVFFINGISAMAGLVLLRVCVIIIRNWLQAQWVKQNGVETEAHILQTEVMNEPGRCTPFVKLKIAVTTLDKGTFIADIATFFHPCQLPQLTTAGTITIRYNPSNISNLQVIKKTKAFDKERRRNWQPVSTTAYLAMVQ